MIHLSESDATAKQDTQTRSRARLFSLDFDVQRTDSKVSYSTSTASAPPNTILSSQTMSFYQSVGSVDSPFRGRLSS